MKIPGDIAFSLISSIAVLMKFCLLAIAEELWLICCS